MHEEVVPAGERRRILWIMSSSIPGTVRFRAEPVDGGAPAGTVELVRRRWFQSETTEHPLDARNVFKKGISDADYRIFVTPERDCRIVFETRHFRAELYLKLLIGFIAVAFVVGLTSYIISVI